MKGKKQLAALAALIIPMAAMGRDLRNVPVKYVKAEGIEQPASIKFEIQTFNKDGNVATIAPIVGVGSSTSAPLYADYIADTDQNYEDYALKVIDASSGKTIFKGFPNLKKLGYLKSRDWNWSKQTANEYTGVQKHLIKKMFDDNLNNLASGNTITIRPITASQAIAKYGANAFKGDAWMKLTYPFEIIVSLNKLRPDASGSLAREASVHLVESYQGEPYNTIISLREGDKPFDDYISASSD